MWGSRRNEGMVSMGNEGREEIVGVQSTKREVMRGKVIKMWICDVGERIRSDRSGNTDGRDSRLEGKALINRRSVRK